MFLGRLCDVFVSAGLLSNNFFRFGVEFFSIPKRKKISSTRKRNYCVLSRCACAKLKTSLSVENFLKWTPALTLQYLVFTKWPDTRKNLAVKISPVNLWHYIFRRVAVYVVETTERLFYKYIKKAGGQLRLLSLFWPLFTSHRKQLFADVLQNRCS